MNITKKKARNEPSLISKSEDIMDGVEAYVIMFLVMLIVLSACDSSVCRTWAEADKQKYSMTTHT